MDQSERASWTGPTRPHQFCTSTGCAKHGETDLHGGGRALRAERTQERRGLGQRIYLYRDDGILAEAGRMGSVGVASLLPAGTGLVSLLLWVC